MKYYSIMTILFSGAIEAVDIAVIFREPELILFNRGITGKFEGRKAISAFVALRATNQIPLCYMVDITN